MGRTKKTETRAEGIRRIAEREYRKGTSLPDARRVAAKELGGDASLYLGTVDPIYFRLVGEANPLPASAAKSAASLRSAVRKRRDEGVRWETVAASASVTLGRKVSVTETKTLYGKAGGDLESSYAGRGTRVAAPKTYADPAVAPETTVEAKKPAKKTTANA